MMQTKLFLGIIATGMLLTVQADARAMIKSISIVEESASPSEPSIQTVMASEIQKPVEKVVITIETKTGEKYQIQGVGDLLRDVWTSLGDAVIADGKTIVISLPRTDAFTFFRVVALQKNDSLEEPKAPVTAPPQVPSAPPAF